MRHFPEDYNDIREGDVFEFFIEEKEKQTSNKYKDRKLVSRQS